MQMDVVECPDSTHEYMIDDLLNAFDSTDDTHMTLNSVDSFDIEESVNEFFKHHQQQPPPCLPPAPPVATVMTSLSPPPPPPQFVDDEFASMIGDTVMDELYMQLERICNDAPATEPLAAEVRPPTPTIEPLAVEVRSPTPAVGPLAVEVCPPGYVQDEVANLIADTIIADVDSATAIRTRAKSHNRRPRTRASLIKLLGLDDSEQLVATEMNYDDDETFSFLNGCVDDSGMLFKVVPAKWKNDDNNDDDIVHMRFIQVDTTVVNVDDESTPTKSVNGEGVTMGQSFSVRECGTLHYNSHRCLNFNVDPLKLINVESSRCPGYKTKERFRIFGGVMARTGHTMPRRGPDHLFFHTVFGSFNTVKKNDKYNSRDEIVYVVDGQYDLVFKLHPTGDNTYTIPASRNPNIINYIIVPKKKIPRVTYITQSELLRTQNLVKWRFTSKPTHENIVSFDLE